MSPGRGSDERSSTLCYPRVVSGVTGVRAEPCCPGYARTAGRQWHISRRRPVRSADSRWQPRQRALRPPHIVVEPVSWPPRSMIEPARLEYMQECYVI
jgi:hypothetical protein